MAEIRETRTHKDRSATGVVRARSGEHVAFAGAVAWAELAETFGDEPTAQIACAEAGIAELADRYITPAIDDSTDLKLFAARRTLSDGRAPEAGAMLLRILRDRLAQYRVAHAKILAPAK